jgi:hypothetical protein
MTIPKTTIYDGQHPMCFYTHVTEEVDEIDEMLRKTEEEMVKKEFLKEHIIAPQKHHYQKGINIVHLPIQIVDKTCVKGNRTENLMLKSAYITYAD